MTILVIAEHDNKVLAPATLNTVAAAAKIGGDIHVLVAGQGAGAVAEAAAKIAGVSKVLLADNAAYAHQLPENVAPLVAELGAGYSHILAAATSNGKTSCRALPLSWTLTRSPRSSRSKAPTPSSARSTPVTPLPPYSPTLR